MKADRPQVALVGRPNVGKSRLFNRICGGREAIVHDRPGVTRDRLARDHEDGYTLIDTGGIGLSEEGTPAAIARAVEDQVFVAVEAADLILFVVDAREGLVPLDEEVAAQLRSRARCPVAVIANKCDQPAHAAETYAFASLGFGEPLAVSAEHRLGIGELHRRIATALDLRGRAAAARAERAGGEGSEEEGEPGEAPHRTGIALVGKPNVGKSSLSNRLLESERMIVTDQPGTTRDTVAFDLDYTFSNGTKGSFRLADTAGLRARHKVDSPVEYFSSLRSRKAIEESDVVFLLLDAVTGVTRQDKALAGAALEAGRGLVVVVNKWDLSREAFVRGGVEGYRNEEDFRRKYRQAVREELFFLPRSPFLFASAETGLGIDGLLQTARQVDAHQRRTLPTGKLNRVVHDLVAHQAPSRIHGRPFKLFYVVQTGIRPIRLRIFCNDPSRLEDPYRRYLVNGILEAFELQGTPIGVELRGKERRFAGSEGKA